MQGNIKLNIEVEVWCGNDEPPPSYLIARYVREKMPTLIMKGDLMRMETNRRSEKAMEITEAEGIEGGFDYLLSKEIGWDDYAVHLRSKVTVLNA